MKRSTVVVAALALAVLALAIASDALRAQVSQAVNRIRATTCTNQFVRAIAATGLATCAAVDNASLATMALYTVKVNNTAGTATPTDVNIGAWATWVPTLSCLTTPGTYAATLNAARFLQIGKLVFFTLDFTVTTVSTCAGAVTFTLPATNLAVPPRFTAAAQEYGVTSKMWTCLVNAQTNVFCNLYDGTFPALTGGSSRLVITGHYEAS